MNQSTQDTGVIAALLERLETLRLPRLLAIQEKVDAGEPLGDLELDFMERAIADVQDILPIIDRHPEYQQLTTQVVTLYKEISEKALQLEKNA
ncbi:MAG: hypothetical protein U9Q75_06400 [Pseudomonadota bacterium]|nr:hypothetical protein [Pseudomonadota bacterium]